MGRINGCPGGEQSASVINTVGHYVEKGKATFETVLLARPRGMDLGYNTT